MTDPFEDSLLDQVRRDLVLWRKSPWNSEECLDAVTRTMANTAELLHHIDTLRKELAAKEGK